MTTAALPYAAVPARVLGMRQEPGGAITEERPAADDNDFLRL